MDFVTSVALKFGINVCPYMRTARQTYIPDTVFRQIEGILPEHVSFMVANGDVYEGHFNAIKQCFVGVREMLKRYRVNDINFLSMQYINGGRLMVTIFDSSAVEIEYPTKAVYVKRKDVDFRRVPPMNLYNFSTVMSLQDHLNIALLKFNARDVNALSANVYMPENVYQEFVDFVRLEDVDEDLSKEWVDGGSIDLVAGNKSWKVTVKKLCDRWYLCEGWPLFALDLGVGDSDLLELLMTESHSRLEVAYYKDYAMVAKCVYKKLGVPCHYFKIVSNQFLLTGEMKIPCLFEWKYENEFDAEMQIIGPLGISYSCLYLEFDHKLVQLKEFITGCNLQEGMTLVFQRVERSKLFVIVYSTDLIDTKII